MEARNQALTRPARWTRAAFVALIMLGGLSVASPAWAHGVGETKVGYLLVQQALGHLAHNQSPEGVMLAQEKIDDALATKEQQGVDVSLLKRAQAELMAGHVEVGRELLQASIAAAVRAMPRATGDATGTGLIPVVLPGRGALTNGDWTALLLFALLTAAGTSLAVRYRPAHTVRALSQQLRNLAPAGTDSSLKGGHTA